MHEQFSCLQMIIKHEAAQKHLSWVYATNSCLMDAALSEAARLHINCSRTNFIKAFSKYDCGQRCFTKIHKAYSDVAQKYKCFGVVLMLL